MSLKSSTEYFKSTNEKFDSRRKRNEPILNQRRERRFELLRKRRNVAAPQDTDVNIDIKDLPALIHTFKNDPANQFDALQKIRKLLSVEVNPPIQTVIDEGLVPAFIHLLQHGNDDMKFEAAWSITNIASGSSEETRCLVELGAIPVLVASLSLPIQPIVDQCVWALGNIAGDSCYTRDLILREGALSRVIDVINNNPKRVLLRNATWTLSNLCRGKDPKPDWNVVRKAIPTVARLIYSRDENVVSDACWALSYLTDGDDDQITEVTSHNVVQRLVELLEEAKEIQIPSIRTLGNIVAGTEVHTQMALQNGIMEPLTQLILSSKTRMIKKETCWTLSNIAAGSTRQLTSMYRYPILQPILNFIETESQDIQRECVWIITNTTANASEELIKYMVDNNVMRTIVFVLESKDISLIEVILGALDNILMHGESVKLADGTNPYLVEFEKRGGLVELNNLQYCENKKIYNRAVDIIDRYCDTEEDEEPVFDFEMGNTESSTPIQTNFTFSA